jgi:drug/metabolite transporter (DMT)-like permease
MGLSYALASTLCLTLAGFCYSYSFYREPALHPSLAALIRVLVAFVPPIYLVCKTQTVSCLKVVNVRDLLIWGVAGAATVTTYFIASQQLGTGLTQFLSSTQGLVLILFGPFLLNKPFKWENVFSMIFIGVGLYFVLVPSDSHFQFSNAILFGILSGVCAGIAYIFMARARHRNRNEIIHLYWAIPSILVQLFLLTQNKNTWAFDFEDSHVWITLIGGGIFTMLSQIFLSEAFQTTSIILITTISSFGYVLNLFFDISIGKLKPGSQLEIGILVMLFGSIGLPFLIQKTRRRF